MSTTATKAKARDLMTTDPAVLDATDTLATAAKLFEQHEISGAPVVGARGQVVGVISKTDLIRHALEDGEEGRFLFQMLDEDEGTAEPPNPSPMILVEDVMNPDPVIVQADDSASVVARRMVESHVHRVVVVDDQGCPIGVVTTMDLVQLLADL